MRRPRLGLGSPPENESLTGNDQAFRQNRGELGIQLRCRRRPLTRTRYGSDDDLV